MPPPLSGRPLQPADLSGAASLPNLTAVIVGDGPRRRRLEQLSAELGLGARVTFAGHQSNVERWLGQARVFVLTSDSEGLSLSLMEAMMSGLPAVVSNVGDLGDLVEEGVNGHLVEARTADAFAPLLVALLKDPARLTRFSRAARQAAEVHAPAAVSARWDAVLNELDRVRA